MNKREFSRRLLLGALASAWLPGESNAASAPPLLLAQNAPGKLDPKGYLVSEKLDGARALWDGRRLLFRSGIEIAAPDWFTARLPSHALDGELWMGRGRFEALSAAVRRSKPQEAQWRSVRYMLFELPGAPGGFEQRVAELKKVAESTAWDGLQVVAQSRIETPAALHKRLREVVAAGGEGLMLHKADAAYATGRSELLLKLKPVDDSEAVVIAHEQGQGRLSGTLGALRVRSPEGREFSIGSGLSDADRREPPPIGSLVRYRFRGLTNTGLPRFATFVRLES